MDYLVYPDGSIAFGMNVRKYGKYGKKISKDQYEKVSKLPNRGLRVAMFKRL